MALERGENHTNLVTCKTLILFNALQLRKTHLTWLNNGHISCPHFPLHPRTHGDSTSASTQHEHFIIILGSTPCCSMQGEGAHLLHSWFQQPWTRTEAGTGGHYSNSRHLSVSGKLQDKERHQEQLQKVAFIFINMPGRAFKARIIILNFCCS